MQLALLTGAIPRTCARGPKVRLQRGRWRFECAGLNDSILFLLVESPSSDLPIRVAIQREVEFEILEATVAHVDFVERGNENYISIFASKVA